MRKLIFILLLFASLVSRGQYTRVDTTLAGDNAIVLRPDSYYITGNADSTIQCIVFMYGAGETSASYATLASIGGPVAYMETGGFNGKVVMPAGDTLTPIVIGLRCAAYYTNGQLKSRMDAIKSAFKIKDQNLHIGGFSMGGDNAKLEATEDNLDDTPPYGPFTYADGFRSIVDVMGVIPDDNANWYDKVKNFARNNVGGRYFGLWGTGDGERGIERFRDTMNAVSSNSAYVEVTSDSHSYTAVHKVWGNPSGTAPLTFTMFGRTLTVWQQVLLWGADTTQPTGGNYPPIVSVRDDTTMLFLADSITLTGSATDVDGTVASHVWTKTSGPSCTITSPTSYTTTVTGLSRGTYVFRLTATDDLDSSAYAEVTVNNGIPCNTADPQTYILTPVSGEIYIPDAYSRGWKGGDSVKIPAGYYSLIEIDSFGGDPCRNIIIVPYGGRVHADIIRFKRDCHYVTLTGIGVPDSIYGFKCRTLAGTKTAWFKNHRIEIGPNPSGVGVFWKQDNQDFVDSLNSFNQTWAYTNYGNWFDSLYIHDIDGEGMYIGHTGPDGNEETYGIVPQRGRKTWITNCILENLAWDGIQLSNSRDSCIIANNTVTNFGTIDKGSQRAGIILGGNTTGQVYGNTVSNGKGNGIQAFGYGDIQIFNNNILNVGLTDSMPNGEQAIFTNAYLNLVEDNPNMDLTLTNNYILNPQPIGAIQCNNDGGKLGTVVLINNRFCIPGAAGSWKSDYIIIPTGYTDTNNYLYCNPSGLGIRLRLRIKQ